MCIVLSAASGWSAHEPPRIRIRSPSRVVQGVANWKFKGEAVDWAKQLHSHSVNERVLSVFQSKWSRINAVDFSTTIHWASLRLGCSRFGLGFTTVQTRPPTSVRSSAMRLRTGAVRSSLSWERNTSWSRGPRRAVLCRETWKIQCWTSCDAIHSCSLLVWPALVGRSYFGKWIRSLNGDRLLAASSRNGFKWQDWFSWRSVWLKRVERKVIDKQLRQVARLWQNDAPQRQMIRRVESELVRRLPAWILNGAFPPAWAESFCLRFRLLIGLRPVPGSQACGRSHFPGRKDWPKHHPVSTIRKTPPICEPMQDLVCHPSMELSLG